MINNNRIIKRIAAYYTADGHIDNTIKQSDSNKQYNEVDKADIQLRRMMPDLSATITQYLKYQPNRAGLCGDSFISKTGDTYIIEWQVSSLNSYSIDTAYEQLDIMQQEQQQQANFNIAEHEQLCEAFEDYIQQNYFLGVILIFKNNNFYDFGERKKFSKNTSQAEILRYGRQLIQEEKQKLLLKRLITKIVISLFIFLFFNFFIHIIMDKNILF